MRSYSLAYLTANRSSVLEALDIANELGYDNVGLRLRPNTVGAPYQEYINDSSIQREALARVRNNGVGVFDIEIVRIDENFNVFDFQNLFEAGAALKAKAVLVAGDDANTSRLAENYAKLCEYLLQYRMTADLEFMPWTGVKNALSALAIIHQAGTPTNAGILFDALHFGRSNTKMSDIEQIPENLLHYAQICDAKGGEHFSTQELILTAREERLLPGEGDIDIKGLFAKLPQIIPISVELPNFKRSEKMGDKAWARVALEASKRSINAGS
jgi:sugar phosphate isomerase/epimerase